VGRFCCTDADRNMRQRTRRWNGKYKTCSPATVRAATVAPALVHAANMPRLSQLIGRDNCKRMYIARAPPPPVDPSRCNPKATSPLGLTQQPHFLHSSLTARNSLRHTPQHGSTRQHTQTPKHVMAIPYEYISALSALSAHFVISAVPVDRHSHWYCTHALSERGGL
jgi:hypothetical protein